MEQLQALSARERAASQVDVGTGRNRALDFGCAVGRLTQALADHFAHVVGVDIAQAMVDQARAYNRHGARVDYVLNTAPDLRVFGDASFDFVYCNKVLQHIRPRAQLGFIREFVRLLRPGGVAAFQMRNGPDVRPGSMREQLYLLNRVHLRRLFQRVRGRTPYEMHYVARAQVEQALAEVGGRLLEVRDISQERPGRSLFYWVART
jgi:2-polyprenyl-3-methyl-5-hydroxy-6-metoxy-1,4-benzoquinol methylase